MTGQRVFEIWTHPLFHEALRRMLAGTGVELVGGLPAHAAAGDPIARARPDTIIVEEPDEDGVSAEVLDLVQAVAANVWFVCVSQVDGELRAYQRPHPTLGRGEGLLQLICG